MSKAEEASSQRLNPVDELEEDHRVRSSRPTLLTNDTPGQAPSPR